MKELNQLAVTGHDPIATWGRLLDRGFFAEGALGATLVTATPLLLTGLAAAAAEVARAGQRVAGLGGGAGFGRKPLSSAASRSAGGASGAASFAAWSFAAAA